MISSIFLHFSPIFLSKILNKYLLDYFLKSFSTKIHYILRTSKENFKSYLKALFACKMRLVVVETEKVGRLNPKLFVQASRSQFFMNLGIFFHNFLSPDAPLRAPTRWLMRPPFARPSWRVYCTRRTSRIPPSFFAISPSSELLFSSSLNLYLSLFIFYRIIASNRSIRAIF